MSSLADTLKFLHRYSADEAAAEKNGDQVRQAPFMLPALHIAVQGCCHGELDRIYEECRQHTQQTGKKIDLLICCGDFQSTRNAGDLATMAVPQKFRVLGDFPKYASGAATAPVLTLFIGGNHEASAALFEQYHGGFLAPNIYYLGHSGVVNIGGLRIGGLSGVHYAADVHQPYPVPPYRTVNHDETDIRSAYHIRKFELDKLLMLPPPASLSSSSSNLPPLDIFISHDWPVGVTDHGDVDELLRIKPYFRDDIGRRALGNPHTMQVLQHLRPKRWFAAHLHCRFRALIPHRSSSNSGSGGEQQQSHTDFLALNKCVRNPNEFMEFVDVTPQPDTVQRLGITALSQVQQPLNRNQLTICVDPEWCDVVKRTHWRVPLKLPAAKLGQSEVEWVAQSMAGAKQLQQHAATRRKRGDGDGDDDDEKKGRTMQVVASDTMGLLYNLGLLDEQQKQEKQSSHQNDDPNDGDDDGMTGSAEQADDEDEQYGWEEDTAHRQEQHQSAAIANASQKREDAQHTLLAGGVLQQNNADDVGFGWTEDE